MPDIWRRQMEASFIARRKRNHSVTLAQGTVGRCLHSRGRGHLIGIDEAPAYFDRTENAKARHPRQPRERRYVPSPPPTRQSPRAPEAKSAAALAQSWTRSG